MKILNRIKSKLIDTLISSGRYPALREGLYDEVFCKSYCSVEVPSAVLETQNRESCTLTNAVRKVVEDRVSKLRESGDINITDEQFEVFKNELHAPDKGTPGVQGGMFRTIVQRVREDCGITDRKRTHAVHIRKDLMQFLQAREISPGPFINDLLEIQLKEMGYGK